MEEMSNDRVEGIKEFSKKSRNVDCTKYKFGSNYVPAEITMSVEEEENNREVIGVIDDDVDEMGNVIQDYNRKYKTIWTLHIYPCQKIDFFGEKMYAVPYFQVRGSRIL